MIYDIKTIVGYVGEYVDGSYIGDCTTTFNRAVFDYVAKMQAQGLQVDIQFQGTDSTNSARRISAMVICRRQGEAYFPAVTP